MGISAEIVLNCKSVFCGIALVDIVLPSPVQVLGESCSLERKSVSSVTFESTSRLLRIEKWPFIGTGSVEIEIPSSIGALTDECFGQCRLFPSIKFQSESKLLRTESQHALKLDWLRSLFFHRLKSRVDNALLNANQFQLFRLNMGRYYFEFIHPLKP
jgi:hypothetical protein